MISTQDKEENTTLYNFANGVLHQVSTVKGGTYSSPYYSCHANNLGMQCNNAN